VSQLCGETLDYAADFAKTARYSWIISSKAYAQLNRIVMSILFALPIAALALFEAQMNVKHSRRMRVLFGRDHADDEGDDDESAQNPECDDDDEGDISTKEFKELVKDFPE
jgi:hypothetical protein